MWAQQHPSKVVFGWESGWALSNHCCLPALTPRSSFQRVWPSAPSQMGPSLFIFVSPMAGRVSGMFICFCGGKHILKSSQIECMERESS